MSESVSSHEESLSNSKEISQIPIDSPKSIVVVEENSSEQKVINNNLQSSDENKESQPLNISYTESKDVQKSNVTNVLEWSSISVKYGTRTKISEKIRNLVIRKKPKYLQMLDGVCGRATSGRLCGVIGGKSFERKTLIKVLSSNLSSSLNFFGNITYNNRMLDMKKYCSVIQQDGVFMPLATVQEHLLFYIRLKCSRNLSRNDRKNLLKGLIEKFNLQSCLNKSVEICNTSKDSISSSQLARLNIATEMVTDPLVVFFEEFTTGIDSSEALSIAKCLKRISSENRIVICSAAQPNSEIFSMFDDIVIMAERTCIGYGPVENIFKLFKSCGNRIGKHTNPADHILDYTTIKSTSDSTHREFISLYKREFYANYHNNKNAEEKILSTTSIFEDDRSHLKSGTSFGRQYIELLSRIFVVQSRNPMKLIIKLIEYAAIGIFIGLIYYQLKRKFDNLVNIFGAIFSIIACISILQIISTLLEIPADIEFFKKEYKKKLYSTAPYLLSRATYELIVTAFGMFLYSIGSYWIIGLYPEASSFFAHYGIVLLFSLCSRAFGYLSIIIGESLKFSTYVVIVLAIPLLIFSGFFQRAQNVSAYFVWIQYISWFKHSFQSMAIIQFHNKNILCDNLIACLSNLNQEVNGDLALDLIQFKPGDFYINIGLLFAILAVYCALAYLILMIKVRRF